MKQSHKLVIVFLFILIVLIEMKCHSLRWNSFLEACLFLFLGFSDHIDRMPILENISLVYTIFISILFVSIKWNWISILLIVLMFIYILIALPTNYINDPDMNF